MGGRQDSQRECDYERVTGDGTVLSHSTIQWIEVPKSMHCLHNCVDMDTEFYCM
jgi:hypothetical protein